MTQTLRILIVGGYGMFGGRLVELLEHEPRLTLIVAGRSAQKARDYCAARGVTKAALKPAEFDRSGDLKRQIAELEPHIVVDASGPFQVYGAKPYALIEACIEARVDYLDLADGSDFVAGVGSLQTRAHDAGVYVLSGVSSFPVLTAAAVRALSHDLGRIESIKGGIAPSPFARVGENVIRAISGYAGKPVRMKKGGAEITGYPFTEQMRFTIAPPGFVPLKSTLFSLVDVPDLRALAELWPDVSDVWMGAGPVPQVLHRALIVFAWAVRLWLIPSLLPLAPMIHLVIRRLRWGEHRGGMFVEVHGVDRSGERVTSAWHLLAEGEDGPLIPSMAVAAIVLKCVEGHRPGAGARSATQELELADYDVMFAKRTIVAGFRYPVPPDAPLYRRVLGEVWEKLPAPVREMHDLKGPLAGEGKADIDRGHSFLARLIATIFGFPKAGRDVPVRVQFEVANGRETWTRVFAGKTFSSVQFEGSGLNERLICERFGPLVFAMALPLEGDTMRLVLRRWTAFGVPLPLWLCPRADAYETAEGGRFRFHVEIKLPIIGLIVRYRGWLQPVVGPKTVS